MSRLFVQLAWLGLLSTWARCTHGQSNCTEMEELGGQRSRAAASSHRDSAEQGSDEAMLLQYGSASVTLFNPNWTAESEVWLDTNRSSPFAPGGDGDLPGASVNPVMGALGKIFSSGDHSEEKNQSKYVQRLRNQMQMKQNDEGDLDAFLSSLLVNCGILVVIILGFSIMALAYPIVYSDNCRQGLADSLPSGLFGWVVGSYGLQFEDVERTAGLDAALFIEFVQLAIRICIVIAVPFLLILSPLHYWFGGNHANDKLSKIGVGNLADGSWVFWVHAVLVWYVVLMTQLLVHAAQDRFVKKRFAWIARMPHPRDTTVLVEGIPQKYCSDDALKAYFVKLFSEEQVESAYVIKYTAALESYCADYEDAVDNLERTEVEWRQAGGTQETRPTCRDYSARVVDKMNYYETIKCQTARQVLEERKRIEQGTGVVYTNTGFVTFKRRRDAAVALYLKVEADDCIFAMSTPPDPTDVIYADFMQAGSWLTVKETMGYASCVGLFFAFTPIILGISSLINEEVILKAFPVLKKLFLKYPSVESFVSGLLASAALTLVMSFLPSLFLLIFKTFFQLKAGQWVQFRLQQWYFWFQVLFILLIPAVGASLIDTILTIIDHPMSVVIMLAYRLPTSTHFYMNYIVMQWMTHGLNITRYMNFIKYKAFSAVFNEDRAKELSEPEDQDYYGIGGRSARFTLVLSVGLVYCSLCPLITVLACINFLICRIFYGYLIVFAEKPKPDLGGVFWVSQLKHIQCMQMIYVTLMTGVLSQRAANLFPAMIVAPALIFLYKSFVRFHTAYDWEFLSFSELVNYESELTHSKQKATRDTYAQPELSVPHIGEEDAREPFIQPPRGSI